MKTLLAFGGVFIAIGVSLGAPALMDYADQRAAWRAVSGDVEAGGYDAALSDALYRESEETRLDAEWAGMSFILGCLLISAGWTPRPESKAPSSPWKVNIIDGSLAWALLLIACGGENLGLWDTHQSAIAASVASAAPLLFFLPYAGLVAGRSPGLWLMGGGLPESRAVRLRTLLLAPFSFPVLLLTFWATRRFPWLKAIHLPRVAGAAETSAPKSI